MRAVAVTRTSPRIVACRHERRHERRHTASAMTPSHPTRRRQPALHTQGNNARRQWQNIEDREKAN